MTVEATPARLADPIPDAEIDRLQLLYLELMVEYLNEARLTLALAINGYHRSLIERAKRLQKRYWDEVRR